MSWLFKKSPKQKALDEKVKQARWQAYEKGRLARARSEGLREGKTTRTERALSTMQGIGSLSKQLDSFGSSMLGDFGYGPPRKKAHHHKKKGKTITIHVK